MLHFLTELVQLSKPQLTEAAFKVFNIMFSDEYLSRWVALLVQACCKRLVQKPLTSHHAYENYVGVILLILARPRYKAAWLDSPYFYTDLEMLYSLHLLTTQEWRDYLKVLYHPLLNTSLTNKLKYEKNFGEIRD